MMNQLPTEHRDPDRLEAAGRQRKFGVVVAQLALAATLIVSIVVVLIVGASSAMAQARTDLMVMEESTALTTVMIVAVIVLVMGILTVLAIRDASPKSSASRRTSVRR